MNLANQITCLRILLILPIIYLTSLQTFSSSLMALFLFVLAGLTDYLDGYIARKTDSETNLGALLDLLADKLLVCITLVWLLTLNNTLIFAVPVLIIILRELVISSIRQNIVEKKGQNYLKVSMLGKSKTTIQFIAISLIIIAPELPLFFNYLSISFLWLASLASIISLYSYIIIWKHSLS